MSTDKKVALWVAGISLLVSVVLWILDAASIMIASMWALMLTAILHHFLGGTEGARIKWRAVEFTGAGAVFVFFGWFINGELKENKTAISPNPDSWIAVDSSGAFIPVTIGNKTYEQNITNFLRGAEWGTETDSGMIWVTKGNHRLAQLDPTALDHAGLFNSIEMSQGKGIQYSTELHVEEEESLAPVYPFIIRATQFKEEYNEFTILGEHGEVVLDLGLLRTRNFQVFEHEEQYYLVFVVRARHNDPVNPPWAVFGLTQITLELSIAQ